MPFRVEGEINPRVTIGRTQFVLGTLQTPVQTSQLRTAALARQLDPVLNARSFRGLTNTADPLDQVGFSDTATLPVRVLSLTASWSGCWYVSGRDRLRPIQRRRCPKTCCIPPRFGQDM